MGGMSSSEWMSVDDAAAQIGKKRRQVYRYLALPEKDTGIRRIRTGRTTLVHRATFLDFEATVKTGRPPKT